jgi:mannose-6-phosphate isomerase-like protein (cupin superfamily)
MTALRTPENLWFLNTLVTVRVAAADGANGMTVLEHQAPFGDSAPLHVHHTEDEVFHVISGELRCRIGGHDLTLRAGETAQAPMQVPHTYAVVSQGARWLTVTCGGEFERLVRSLSRPAEHDGLPPAAPAPTPEQRAALGAACLANGVELVGPPLLEAPAAA